MLLCEMTEEELFNKLQDAEAFSTIVDKTKTVNVKNGDKDVVLVGNKPLWDLYFSVEKNNPTREKISLLLNNIDEKEGGLPLDSPVCETEYGYACGNGALWLLVMKAYVVGTLPATPKVFDFNAIHVFTDLMFHSDQAESRFLKMTDQNDSASLDRTDEHINEAIRVQDLVDELMRSISAAIKGKPADEAWDAYQSVCIQFVDDMVAPTK